jgi:hypothetical protein
VTSSRARIVTVGGSLCSVACVAILHVVRTDLPPVSHRLSEYANGPHGWIMAIAFVSLSCGLVALGLDLWPNKDREGITWAIAATAFLAAAGSFLSAAFPTGVSGAGEAIHSGTSSLAVVAVVALALGYSVLPARYRPVAASDRVAKSLALAVAALVVTSPVLHQTRWTGLSQRILWIAVIAWLLRVAVHHPPRRDAEVDGRMAAVAGGDT